MDGSWKRNRDTSWTALRFAIAGGISTAFTGALTYLLVAFASIEPKSAALAAYLVALPLNYAAQRKFSFRSSGPLQEEIPRYVAVHCANLALSWFIMHLCVDIFDCRPQVGIALNAIAIPVNSFMLLRLWVFVHRTSRGK